MTLSITAIAVLAIFILWKWTSAKGSHVVIAVVAGVLLASLLGAPVRNGAASLTSVVEQAAASLE